MDDAAAFLNDTAKNLYTYAVQLPYLKLANQNLEQLLLSNGLQVQRVYSSTITVLAGAKTLTLPNDFLLPIQLFERPKGSTDDAAWVEITERTWDPEPYTQGPTLQYWAFRNNNVNFPGSLADRDVLMRYERQLAAISGQNSPEDFVLARAFLAAKTAELCARFIGMNKTFADDLRSMEVSPAEDRVIDIFVQKQQGLPGRRRRFRTQKPQIY